MTVTPKQPAVTMSAGEERFRTLFSHTHDAVAVLTSAGHLADVNPATVELFGHPEEELREMHFSTLFPNPREFDDLQGRLEAPGSVENVEVRLQRVDGRQLTCLLTVVEHPAGECGEPRYLAIVDDLTDRVHVEERFQHAALHDTLTQLPNRAFFLDRLQRLLERWKYDPTNPFAALFVDVDRFKLINDSLGHRAGDELLIMMAERLLELVRPGDIVARFGGDEFAILLLDLPGTDVAPRAARRIQRGLREEPFNILGHDVYITASIGIAMGSREYASADEIIRDADTAMYAAKDEGRGRWTMFNEEMRQRAVLSFTTETALQQALERDEFLLHYQPLVTIDTGRIVGFEALVRWDHPERGLLPPADFLPLAEDTGLIVPLGRWVLAKACRTAADWRRMASETEERPFIAVNVSARQLMDPALSHDVRSVLEETGLPAAALRLEITETVFLEHSATVRKSLAELVELGILLCLDDFGTGYSSLSYLKQLPVGLVKIDRSFITGLSGPDGERGTEVAGAMVSLARQLGMETVAEGVETEDERQRLMGLGCRHAQGFLYSRPLSEDDALSLYGEGAGQRLRRVS